MGIYITHDSALEYWRAASEVPHCANPSRPSKSKLRKVAWIPSSAAVSRLKPTEEELAAIAANQDVCFSSPLHLLVPAAKYRVQRASVVSHVCGSELTRDSFVRIGDGRYVASPELCFVQMSGSCSFAQLACLGFELCGTYRLRPESETGMTDGYPLASTISLRSYIDRQQGLHGVALARRAVRYIIQGSASPRESALALLLFLPHRYGGYGLPWPQMNYRRDVGRNSRKGAAKGYYRCDLYWPRARLAVEYDSDAFHTGSEKIAEDARRRGALTYMGTTVVTVTRRQMMNAEALDETVMLLARLMGFQLRIRSKGWPEAKMRLRRELLWS